MNSKTTEQVSAIISNEEELENTIKQLLAESVARSDISVQGTPEQLQQKYGVSSIDPEVVQASKSPPSKEPFMDDDFGWVVGFSFSIPLVICLIIGIFIIGDVRSSYDNWFYGILGAIIGSAIGYFCAKTVKNNRDKKITIQEKKGGYVLWVTTHSKAQHQQVLKILKKHHSEHIKH